MPESVLSFQSLPAEYQHVIQLAQKLHNISITPLQELVGGWSGAFIYLVSVASSSTSQVEHLILKLDRKRPMATSDEVTRHQTARNQSPPDFARQHIPEMVYEPAEAEDALAIFYAIAGHSLYNFRTLSKHRRQSQLETLFSATNHYLLDEWNATLSFEPVDHPQALLKRWLGFRLNPGQKIEGFLRQVCRVHPDNPGFIIQGNVFPNPLLYARSPEPWGSVRLGDAIVGLQHGDLNTNNILANFSLDGEDLEGYYLIDFALFKEHMPLLYDQRYLEMSFLVHAMSQTSMTSVIDLVGRLAEHDILEAHQVPMEMAGVNGAIRAGRLAFGGWARDNHPSLHDDLWGQYWLAGAAAGLSYCHKAGQADEIRLAGLIYAAANLKRYFNLFGLSMPAEASQLYREGQIGDGRKAGIGLVSPAAHAVDIREGGGRPPLENLKDFLADKQILLFFDNFEQVIDAAPVAAELLGTAPGVKVLATSRIPLQLHAEHEFPVSPLALPQIGRLLWWRSLNMKPSRSSGSKPRRSSPASKSRKATAP
jgi:hypothetical protein